MTDEMLGLARANATKAGADNVEFLKGYIEEFEEGLSAAGIADIEITETHRVHEHAASAIIRATKAR